ncbi:endolytic transglycosylase MltG [Planosporangium sp. 12N6]|uniref:endolytic transglycosylase MltG n=1 Tax=Planosporangium spinosum TaxID=3402278 RepID=UPI003CF27DC7
MLDELELAFDDHDRGRGQRSRHRRSSVARRGGDVPPKRRGRSLLALALTLVLLGVLGAGGWYGYTKVKGFFIAPDYAGAGTGEVTVQVRPGDSATAIGQTLVDAGVVKSVKAYTDAAKADPHGQDVQPGTYQVRKQMRAKDALALLLGNDSKLVMKVTIREGLTMQATFQELSKATNIPVDQFQAAAEDPVALGVPDFWFNRTDGKQASKTVEGFLFPDTYHFDPGVTAKQILMKMVGNFISVTGESKIVDQAQAKQVSPFEALITASLVQAEAGTSADMPKVSRVVYNRLNHKPTAMPLEFDSATNYWRELHGQERKHNLSTPELNDPSNPYRTYGVSGLPPGPIGNPGKEALLAAINPAPGPWLYFVRIDKAGNSAFADNLPEHERNIATAQKNGAY